MRSVYANDEKIISQWRRQVQRSAHKRKHFRNIGESMGINPPDVDEDFDRFFKEFNPCQSYSKQWWKDRLNTWRFGWGIRDVFVSNLSFSIPATESLQAIAKFAKSQNIYEYMSGSGYWAYLLRKEFEVSICPTDKHHTHYSVSKVTTFVPVIAKTTQKANPPKDNIIMLSWIPYAGKIANGVLKRMHPEQKLILIGEGRGGCCAHYSTFDILDTKFEKVAHHNCVRFSGLHDEISFYKKI